MPYDREEEIKSFSIICEQLQNIHKIKSATYGDSWKKRGELTSVFGNVARKFDRIENIANDFSTFIKTLQGDTNEMLEETVLDMAVYCVLWCVFMLEERPENFNKALAKASGAEERKDG